jgi:hypothetical protein
LQQARERDLDERVAQPIETDRRYSRANGRLVARQSQNSIEWRKQMAKNIILWMLGVPISVLILLNIFGYL